MSWLSDLFGGSDEQEESSTEEPNMSGACNETGHHYGEPHRTSLHAWTYTGSKGDVQIEVERWYRCKKCDKLYTEDETIAYVDVDIETGEVTQL